MTSESGTQPANPPNETKKSAETITLKDGRTLAYARYGAKVNPKTVPVFYFNGTPGCHLECQLVDAPAQALGIPFISTDRPGFGSSTWQDNRALLNWVQDILELADHLGIPKFGVLGLSGGGPYVLACLHAIPRERLVAATIVSGMYPWYLGTTGMMWQTRMLFWVTGHSTWIGEKLIDLTMGSPIRNSDTDKLIKQMEAQTASIPQPQVDKDVMKELVKDEALRGGYLDSMKEALRISSKGCAWEFRIFGQDWGFKIEDLDASRLTIWHGGLDVNVPVGMPEKFVKLLPNTEYKRMDTDGHVSLIVRHREEILSHLLGRL